MEEKIILITTKKELKSTLQELLSDKQFIKPESNFSDDKLSLTKAAKLAGMSIPTFTGRVKKGIFVKHGSGRKIFFLKSEIIEALKNI